MYRIGSSTERIQPVSHARAASRPGKKKGDLHPILVLQTMGRLRLTMVAERRITVRTQPHFTLPLLALLLFADAARPDKTEAPLLTVAEKTEYKATSRHADVLEFCERLAKLSP